MRLSATVAVLASLASFAGAAPFAYVPNSASGTLSVIDVASNSVTATVPVGALPMFVAIHPNRTRLYVTNRSDATISVVNLTTNAVVDTIPTGNHPHGVAVHPDGTRAYVAHFLNQDYDACTSSCTGYVSAIDLVTHAVTATFPVGLNIHSLNVHPNGSRLYASDNTNNVLSIISTTTNMIVGTVGTGGTQAQSIVYNPAGTRAYVANTAGNSIGVIDITTDTFITAIAVGNNPVSLAVTPDGSRIYVPNSGASYGGGGDVSVIDTTTNMVVDSIPVGQNPYGISITGDGTKAYVTNAAETGSVSVIDTSSNAVLTTIPVGSRPYAYGHFIVDPPLDVDMDDVPDASEPCFCVGTAASAAVTASGCSVDQVCPCDAPLGRSAWRNRGEYLRCVRNAARELQAEGSITSAQALAITRAAATSACGR